ATATPATRHRRFAGFLDLLDFENIAGRSRLHRNRRTPRIRDDVARRASETRGTWPSITYLSCTFHRLGQALAESPRLPRRRSACRGWRRCGLPRAEPASSTPATAFSPTRR